MTPKEKAEGLFKKTYQPIFDINKGININEDEKIYYATKQCALIAVEEVVKQLSEYGWYKPQMTYWKKVKQEIEKL